MTTSPRTPDAAARALEAGLPQGAYCYRFRAGDAANPYRAMLACADRFVVTGESASLIADAAESGRPVSVVPLEARPLSRALLRLHRWLDASPLRARLDAWAFRGRWIRARDLDALHQAVAETDVEASKRAAVQRIRGLVFDALAREAIG